jgi:hypothetical protein
MDALKAGESLGAGQQLTSGNGKYTLTMQSDGNLVLAESGNPVWATGTNGSGAVRAELQADGNFVLYTDSGGAAWASGTAGNSGGRLVLQDDRNLVVYASDDRVLWSSGTNVAGGGAETAGGQSYTVASGDTLWAIAQRFYGDGSKYQKIADANGISDPDKIQVGQTLVIPA